MSGSVCRQLCRRTTVKTKAMYEKAISLILSLALLVTAFAMFPDETFAVTDDLRLYSIYLTLNPGESPGSGDEKEYGDAVLMESCGKYLLMDTGALYVSKSTISYILNVLPEGQSIDVYISHLHRDHFGALSRILEAGIPIGTVYLPDKESVGTEYISSETGADIQDILNKYFFNIGIKKEQVVWLKKGSIFTVGCVNAEVLGPVGSYSLTDFSDGGSYGSKREGHYLNNCSLTTLFTTPGGIRFLTTGDIEEQEEANLANAYGSRLSADILKLAHHGLKSSSTEAFISKVKPVYAFAENMGYSDPTSDTKGNTVQRFNTPVKTVQKYGMQYMVANEKASLGIIVRGRKIDLYRDKNNDGTLSSAEKMVRWVSVAGISPLNQTKFTGKDNYYISPETGKPLTGISKIGSKTYLFSPGGALQKAYFKGSSYRYYRSYGKRLRRFSKPDKYGRSYMIVGIKKIGSNYFYFDPKTGYRFTAKKGTGGTQYKKVRCGKYYYAVNIKNGLVKKNTKIKLGKATYKADKKGHLTVIK